MKTLWFVVVLLGFLVLRSESHPRHRKSHKHIALLPSNSTAIETQVGHKRVFGVILAAFTAFNNIADFMGRCNNVVGWFDNINRFMGSGGSQGESQVTSQLLDKIKQDIENLATNVEDGFKDLLAGQEYTQILSILADHISILRIVDNLQKEYLTATKGYKETAPADRNQGLMQSRRQKWFDDVDERFVALKNALIILLENICDPILSTYDLFEGYAWKKGEQGTGNLVDLMNFIRKIRTLEANGYGVWKSHILKKWEDDENRRTVELNSVQTKMENVKSCEDPAIARAFTRMVDHQGMPAFGRIRWTHTYENTTGYNWRGEPIKERYDRCLTNLGGSEATPYARECSDNQNQQWKLYPDNTLRPKNDVNKCLFLIEPEETRKGNFQYYGFKVLSCNSNYRNKKFNFEYLTLQKASEPKLHTYFKLKVKNDNFGRESWRGQNICLVYRPIGGWTGTAFKDWSPSVFSCTCPSGQDIHWCLSDYVPDFEYGWFKFEPKSE